MATVISEEDVLLLSREEVARRATALYESDIRARVDLPENIGKMVVIDIETGAYGVDPLGFDSARSLRRGNPNARLFALRIGYKVVASLGGVMERDES
jgi:hypothetical protein